MDKEALVAKLRAAGYEIQHEGRVQSDDRWRFGLSNGTIVDLLDTGQWTAAGPHREAVRSALEKVADASAAESKSLPIVADTMRVVADPASGCLRLQLSGRSAADEAQVTASFLIDEEFARRLASSLAVSAYQMRLASTRGKVATSS
ncbi:MAG: hypothetical protein ACHQAY_13550 [Hyphomicrobiales bacterium]